MTAQYACAAGMIPLPSPPKSGRMFPEITGFQRKLLSTFHTACLANCSIISGLVPFVRLTFSGRKFPWMFCSVSSLVLRICRSFISHLYCAGYPKFHSTDPYGIYVELSSRAGIFNVLIISWNGKIFPFVRVSSLFRLYHPCLFRIYVCFINILHARNRIRKMFPLIICRIIPWLTVISGITGGSSCP